MMRMKIRIIIITTYLLHLFLLTNVLTFAGETVKDRYYPDKTEYQREIPDDFSFSEPVENGFAFSRRKNALMMPLQYDNRQTGVLTPVRNQGQTQACWAYSVIAASESSIISDGLAGQELDLSEYHLGYAFSGDSRDELGLTEGDATYFLQGSWLDSGNNNHYTTFCLANWNGVANQEAYPDSESWYQNRDSRFKWDDLFHVRNIYWLQASDRDAVKRAIQTHGSVGASIYYKDIFYNSFTNAYYNSRITTTNHAISVVGWDDNYDASFFNERPPGNGAWLVKNSRGTDLFDHGYFWVSYYDLSINSASATAFVYEYDPIDLYDHNYHYDGSNGTKTKTLPDDSSVAAVFSVDGSSAKMDEELKAVGFAVADPGVYYRIQIYRDLRDESYPQSGKAVLAEPVTGYCPYTGYYTIPLEAGVQLQNGSRFSIVVTISSHTGYTRVFVDSSYQNAGWIAFVSNVLPNQTFLREPNQAWRDLAEDHTCVRIKAFTKDLNVRTEKIIYTEEETGTEKKGMTEKGKADEIGKTEKQKEAVKKPVTETKHDESENKDGDQEKQASSQLKTKKQPDRKQESEKKDSKNGAEKQKAVRQILKVKNKTFILKARKLKKKKYVISKSKVTKGNSAKTKLTYKLISVTRKKYKKYFSVAKNGKITIRKGLKKGCYKLRIKVTAKKTEKYRSASKRFIVMIRVN